MMSRQELRDWVAETRARQGLPPTISDPATLAKVAKLVADTITVAHCADAAGIYGASGTIKRASRASARREGRRPGGQGGSAARSGG